MIPHRRYVVNIIRLILALGSLRYLYPQKHVFFILVIIGRRPLKILTPLTLKRGRHVLLDYGTTNQLRVFGIV